MPWTEYFKIKNIIKKVDFTTGNANDYSNYGTDAYFEPYGNIDMSNNKNFLILKTTSEGAFSYIEFTVNKNATLCAKVSSTDRGKTSKFVLTKVDGTNEQNISPFFHGESAIMEVEGVSGHTLVYKLEAGTTYRFYCTSTDRVGRVMSMTVYDHVLTEGTK